MYCNCYLNIFNLFISFTIYCYRLVCSRSIGDIAGSNPAEGKDVGMFVLVVCCVGNGLCDTLITRSEKSHRVYVCICVWMI